MRQRDLAKSFKTTEKPPTHGVFHREASNRFLKSASVSYLNEASRRANSEAARHFSLSIFTRVIPCRLVSPISAAADGVRSITHPRV